MGVSVDIRKSWSPAQESLLADLAQRSQSRSVMHGMEYRVYKRLNTLITVPSIVITLFGGAASTSQSSLVDLIGPSSEKYVPLVIGVLSMFVSIMGSVSSFMKIPALTEQHLQAHVSFGKLARKIQSDVQVSPHDRSMPGREACKKYEEMFVALLDIAPPVSKRTESRFSCRSDVKALKMAVPPLVKMGIVKTFTQLEVERLAMEDKAKAMIQAEIARASQPPPLRRGLSTRFNGGGKAKAALRTSASMAAAASTASKAMAASDNRSRVRVEMPPFHVDGDPTGQGAPPPGAVGARRDSANEEGESKRPPRQGGLRKQHKQLKKELTSISKSGAVSRLASSGALNLQDDEGSESSSSESSESSEVDPTDPESEIQEKK